MKSHTKIYLKFFGFTIADFIPCEICGARAVDIHHIEARGMGGGKEANRIENLMALCRTCHTELGDKKAWANYLQTIHGLKIAKQHNNLNPQIKK